MGQIYNLDFIENSNSEIYSRGDSLDILDLGCPFNLLCFQENSNYGRLLAGKIPDPRVSTYESGIHGNLILGKENAY